MTQEASKSRMSHWFAVAAFSTIALVSITSNMVGDISDQIKEVKWAVSAVSIALSFSVLALLATVVLKDKFVGTTIETGMVRGSGRPDIVLVKFIAEKLTHSCYNLVTTVGVDRWFLGRGSPSHYEARKQFGRQQR